MKGKLRALSLFIGFSLLVGSFVGCSKSGGSGDENTQTSTAPAASDQEQTTSKVPAYMNEEGFPIVKQPITLDGMVNVSPVQGDYSQIMVWQEYEKMTGIKINWIQVPKDSVTEKRNLALASGDLPDFFYRMGVTDNELTRYGDQGTFIKLNDLIKDYGTNMTKVMEDMPDVKKSLPDASGNIYGLPTLTNGLTFTVNPKIFINRVWLDNLGMEMPTTLDELYTVLKAFKEKDPNKNGINDEIPWTGWSSTTPGSVLYQVFDTLKGAWGLGNRGRAHQYVDIDPVTNKLRYLPTSPEFKELLDYSRKLYTEGLIDQEIFTMKSSQVVAKTEQGIVGMVCCVNTAFLGEAHGGDFEGIPAMLKGPKGEQLYSAISANLSLSGKGAFTITSANKYPEATMRWIDYFYSDEGIRFFYMGIEGVSYQKTADGKYEYLESITSNIPEGSSFDQVISKYVPYCGGGSPTIVKPEYFKGGETQPAAMQATENVKPYLPKEIWGPFIYTSEETQRRTVLENDIFSYNDQMFAKFVSGKEPLSKWDEYVKQLEKIGLEEYMKIYQIGYDRYIKN